MGRINNDHASPAPLVLLLAMDRALRLVAAGVGAEAFAAGQDTLAVLRVDG